MRPGDRVELVAVSDGYETFRLASGDLGTVEFTDSIGTCHVWWERTGKRVGTLAEDKELSSCAMSGWAARPRIHRSLSSVAIAH